MHATGTVPRISRNTRYEYDLSKRTTLYAMISHSDFEDTELSHSVSGFYRKNKESDTIATNDHITGIQFGMTHRF